MTKMQNDIKDFYYILISYGIILLIYAINLKNSIVEKFNPYEDLTIRKLNDLIKDNLSLL